MSRALAEKLAEDMAYVVAGNSDVTSFTDGILYFSVHVDADLRVTPGLHTLTVRAAHGTFLIQAGARSFVDVFKETFLKTYYLPLLGLAPDEPA